MSSQAVSTPVKGARVVVAGAGALGSNLVPHLARMESIAEITIIDRDRYDRSNIRSLDIRPSDVGKPKANVQARRLRQIRHDLRIVPIVDDLGRVPLGVLNVDLAFSCLDSRSARQRLGERLRRLGVPWVDAGIEAGAMLARVDVYGPASEDSCLECAWGPADYAQLEVGYSCNGMPTLADFATDAPSMLASLAAALEAVEGARLLAGDTRQTGRQVVYAANAHRYFDAALPRNKHCRFDHAVFGTLRRVDCRPKDLTIGQAFEMGRDASVSTVPLRIRAEAGPFARAWTCLRCGRRTRTGTLPRLLLEATECQECRGPVAALGPDRAEELAEGDLESEMLGRMLDAVGLRRGDVYAVTDGFDHERQFQLA